MLDNSTICEPFSATLGYWVRRPLAGKQLGEPQEKLEQIDAKTKFKRIESTLFFLTLLFTLGSPCKKN